MSAQDEIARRQAEAKFQRGEQHAAEAIARKEAVVMHEALMTRIAEQRALRLARAAKDKLTDHRHER